MGGQCNFTMYASQNYRTQRNVCFSFKAVISAVPKHRNMENTLVNPDTHGTDSGEEKKNASTESDYFQKRARLNHNCVSRNSSL